MYKLRLLFALPLSLTPFFVVSCKNNDTNFTFRNSDEVTDYLTKNVNRLNPTDDVWDVKDNPELYYSNIFNNLNIQNIINMYFIPFAYVYTYEPSSIINLTKHSSSDASVSVYTKINSEFQTVSARVSFQKTENRNLYITFEIQSPKLGYLKTFFNGSIVYNIEFLSIDLSSVIVPGEKFHLFSFYPLDVVNITNSLVPHG